MIINNKADKAVIEIFGEIGDDWFEEGVTIQSVNNQIKNITSPEIELRINSLGGDLNQALVILDVLKMHPAKITTKILGATASSGTVIAMAGDEILMSENALFLIHNASTLTYGNADEIRETANNLDKWDERIISIYQKKTGKKKSQIKSLMAEEKWIDATEAKEFGFIHNTFTPDKIAASLTEERKTQILNDLKIKKTEMDIKKEISNLKTWITDNFKAADKPEDFEKTVNNKLAEMESNIDNLENEKTSLNKSVVDLTKELKTANENLQKVTDEKTDLETELGKVKAEKTNLEQNGDPIDPDKDKVTALGTEFLEAFNTEQIEALKYNKKQV